MPRKLSANPRTNVITLRVTPKTRLGLELLAQERGETLTQVVVWAIESMFGTEQVGLLRYAAGEDQATRVLDRVWSPEEHERIVRLGILFPELMNDRQTYLWTRVLETGRYWKDGTAPKRPAVDKVNWAALAKDWPELSRAAGGH